MNFTVAPIIFKKTNSQNSVLRIGDYIKPLRPLYVYNNNAVKFKQSYIKLKDGVSFYKSNMLDNPKDSAHTENTAWYLTNRLNWTDILQDSIQKEVDASVLHRLDSTKFFYSFLQFQTTSTTPPVYLRCENGTLTFSETLRNLCKITKISDEQIQISIIEENKEYLLAVDIGKFSPIVELIENRNIPPNYIINFNYNLVQDNRLSIYFKQTITTNTRVLYQLSFNRFISNETASYIGFYQGKLTAEAIYRPNSSLLNNNNKYPAQFKKVSNINFTLINPGYFNYKQGLPRDSENRWVAYYNELFDKTNNKNVEINPALTINDVPVNYLAVSNFLSQVNSSNNTIQFNILPLKSMYTPEQELFLSKAVNIDGKINLNAPKNIQPIRRSYSKVFAGYNSISSLKKVSLSYTSGTKELTFRPGARTYFHHSIVLPAIPINQSGLIESGAFAGAIPEVSDKLFIENTEYNNERSNRLAPPLEIPDGTFICTWLSGSNSSSISGLEQSIWMDRWYDSSNIQEVSALETSTNAIKSDLKNGVFYDVPSKVIFEPNSYYFYERTSNEKLARYVNTTLDLNKTNIYTSLRINNNSVTDLKDNVVRFSSNDYTLLDTSDIEKSPGYVINLKETTGTINPITRKLRSDDITVATWVKTDSWKNNTGPIIASQDYRSGWEIEASCGISNRLITIAESKYNHIFNCNTDLEFISDNIVPDIDVQDTDFCIDTSLHTEELYTYGFSNCKKQLYKFDLNSDLVDLITLTRFDEITASKLVYGPDNLLYLKANNSLLAINPDLNTEINPVSSIDDNFTATNFIFDLESNIISGDFIDAAVDNNNYIWFISACNIDFFTNYIQPGTNETLFENTEYNIQSLTNHQELNFIFYTNPIEGISNAKPISIYSLYGENITQPVLCPNNIRSKIFSKFFEPKKIVIDKDNYLYIANNKDEIIKTIISETQECGFIEQINLFRRKSTGLNLYGLTEQTVSDISTYNTIIENTKNEPSYFKANITSTTWSEVSSNYSNSNTSIALGFENINKINTTVIYFINNKDKFLYKLNTSGKILDCIRLLSGFNRAIAPTIDLPLTNFNNLYTLYDWQRKYKYKKYKNNFAISVNLYTINQSLKRLKHTLIYDKKLLDKEWYHIAFSINTNSSDSVNIATLYINGLPVDNINIPKDQHLFYEYNSVVCLGDKIGKIRPLNIEIKSQSNLFTGQIDDFKIYNIPLTLNNLAILILYKYQIPALDWNITTRSTSFLEQISRYNIHTLPTFKTNMFNLYISNSKLSTSNKTTVENEIKQNIDQLIPANVYLNNLIWID